MAGSVYNMCFRCYDVTSKRREVRCPSGQQRSLSVQVLPSAGCLSRVYRASQATSGGAINASALKAMPYDHLSLTVDEFRECLMRGPGNAIFMCNAFSKSSANDEMMKAVIPVITKVVRSPAGGQAKVEHGGKAGGNGICGHVAI